MTPHRLVRAAATSASTGCTRRRYGASAATPATSRPTAPRGSAPAGPATGRSSSRPPPSSTTSPGSRPSGCATWPPSSGRADVVANLAPSPPSESEDGFLAALNGSAGWGDAAVIVPWEIYRAYGDRPPARGAVAVDGRVARLRRALGARARAIPIAQRAGPSRLPTSGTCGTSGFHWGEWLEPGEDLKGAEEFEAFRRSDKADVATAYFAHSARLMAPDRPGDRPRRRGRPLRGAGRAASAPPGRPSSSAPTAGCARHAGQPRPRAGFRPRARRAAGRGRGPARRA